MHWPFSERNVLDLEIAIITVEFNEKIFQSLRVTEVINDDKNLLLINIVNYMATCTYAIIFVQVKLFYSFIYLYTSTTILTG